MCGADLDTPFSFDAVASHHIAMVSFRPTCYFMHHSSGRVGIMLQGFCPVFGKLYLNMGIEEITPISACQKEKSRQRSLEQIIKKINIAESEFLLYSY